MGENSIGSLLNLKTINELKNFARINNIKGFSVLNKDELSDLIAESPYYKTSSLEEKINHLPIIQLTILELLSKKSEGCSMVSIIERDFYQKEKKSNFLPALIKLEEAFLIIQDYDEEIHDTHLYIPSEVLLIVRRNNAEENQSKILVHK